MLVKPLGMTIEVMPVPENDAFPTLVNPLGRLVKTTFGQLLNALPPILVTPLGSDVRAMFVQFWNVENPIVVIPLGSDVIDMFEQP